MRYQPTTQRILLLLVAAAAAGLFLGGCGSSGAAHPAASKSQGANVGAAHPTTTTVSKIKADWVAFFAASTPTSRRVALLQNGSQFASVIAAQSKSSLAQTASATVSSVKLTSATQAAVTYTIDVSGSPALSNQKGVAVYQDGTWKVGDSSFCALLTLENSGKTSGLPPACASAS